MRYLSYSVLLCVGMASSALAGPSITAYDTVKTGVQDSSNMWYSSADTEYGFTTTTSSTDPAYYINSISVTPGATWNSNLTFNISNMLKNGFANNNYTLGTALGIGQTYYWSNVLDHPGTFDSSIAAGLYSFDVDFWGGTSSTASSNLYHNTFQVEIVHDIQATVSTVANPSTLVAGQQSHVSATFTNNSTRDFITSSWFISGDAGMQFDSFDGNWFDQTIAAGASRTDAHSSWTALSTDAPGMYHKDCGIIGGFHHGDDFLFGDPGNTVFTVVTPEPTSMAALGLGVLALARRRRKS